MMGGEKRQSAAPVAQEATKSAKKSKHHSYLEVVENVNKKNPLDVQVWSAYCYCLSSIDLLKNSIRKIRRRRPVMLFWALGSQS